MTDVFKLQGLWADLMMPLNEDLSINHAKLKTHVKTLAAKGVSGLVLFGLCGEGMSFSMSERFELVRFLIEQDISGQDILLNASFSNIPDTVQLLGQAHALGVQAFILMPPVSGADCTDQGLIDFFSHILLQVAPLHLRLYLSSQAGSGMTELNARVINELIAKHPNIFHGLIDQSPNASHTLDWIRSFSAVLPVYTTNDMNAQVVSGMGIHTSISSYANLITKLMLRVVTASDADKKLSVAGTKIGDDSVLLNEFNQLLAHMPLVPSLKYLMSSMYHDGDWIRVRPPMSPLNQETQAKLDKAFKKFNLHPHVY
ncbi:MAG: dihydrodipicolinate synthase family protein [Limnohabitans sp.]